MRVISGSARGKKLIPLNISTTKPTLDRVKESIFDILQFNLEDAIILDLFSGTGALGIEALSRGARKSIFCDNSNKAIDIIKKNLIKTNLISKAEIIKKDYIETLEKIKLEFTKFDIIFLDPPYKSSYSLKAIKYIIENNLLKQDGIIVLETNDKNKVNELEKYRGIEIYNIRKYGIVYVLFIRKE